MSKSITEPSKSTPIIGEYEVVVLGGGPAGLAAAVAAGKSGCRTLLVERHGFLGGMGTAAGVSNFCGLYANMFGEHVQVVKGVASDLLARIAHLGGLNEPHLSFGKIWAQAYDIPAYKLAADDLLADAGVDMLFHALAVGISKTSDTLIDALILETKSGRQAIRGRVFIDASGDGDLATWAGAPYEKGDGEGDSLYPSTMFRINGVNFAKAGEAWKLIPKLMQQAEANGDFAFPRKSAIVRPQRNPIEWRANLTQVSDENGKAIDGVDAASLSRGEIIGRSQVKETFRFLKTVPGFEDSYVVEIAPVLGIRETRRIMGDYVLTESDVLECVDFDDTIGRNSWPIEAHVQGDIAWRWQDIPNVRGYNQLPYRMLLPQGLNNLLVAGRCASMTHHAQSAARVTGACFVMGEAAGQAAAMSIEQGSRPRDIEIEKLQAALEANGVLL